MFVPSKSKCVGIKKHPNSQTSNLYISTFMKGGAQSISTLQSRKHDKSSYNDQNMVSIKWSDHFALIPQTLCILYLDLLFVLDELGLSNLCTWSFLFLLNLNPKKACISLNQKIFFFADEMVEISLAHFGYSFFDLSFVLDVLGCIAYLHMFMYTHTSCICQICTPKGLHIANTAITP